MINKKTKKFIYILVLLSLGPIIDNIISIHIHNNYNLSMKVSNFIGLLCMYSYYIGVFTATLLRRFFSV
ncbi:hypothetical protein [Tepidibacter hydrothermalis]|uniref:Uncharacterized protein n=1 Tax=Tepidibacter hydrothermalis TaxID=3036126 RepID=A0ABY8E9L4_9FIRM|nr:hypothetical protein [Tepidibacter hydrothermalis]WFD09621.1 hypothetical protein P4S50_14685 [Tepidibacter hydrothermalis]